MVVVYAAHTIKKLLAALDLAAYQTAAKSELVLLVDMEGPEEKGGQRGDGERVEKGVHARNGVLEESGNLIYGYTEKKKAVGVVLAAFEGGDLEKAAYAGFTDAEDAVKAEAAVLGLGVEVGNDLGAKGNALAGVAGTAAIAAAATAVDACDGVILW